MSSHKTQDSLDKRLIERNIKHGFYDRKHVADHLAGLPDSKAKSITLGEVEDRRAAASGDAAPSTSDS